MLAKNHNKGKYNTRALEIGSTFHIYLYHIKFCICKCIYTYFKYLIDTTYVISFMDIFLKAVLSALSKYPI